MDVQVDAPHCPAAAVYVVVPVLTVSDALLKAAVDETAIVTGKHSCAPLLLRPTVCVLIHVKSDGASAHVLGARRLLSTYAPSAVLHDVHTAALLHVAQFAGQ